MSKFIPFIDLDKQQKRLGDKINNRINSVLAHGKYIMGPEVNELEKKLELYTGANYVATCASGTDALLLSLMAYGIGPGDIVFCPTFTFPATAEAIVILGATPYFIDIEKFIDKIETLGNAYFISYYYYENDILKKYFIDSKYKKYVYEINNSKWQFIYWAN